MKYILVIFKVLVLLADSVDFAGGNTRLEPDLELASPYNLNTDLGHKKAAVHKLDSKHSENY